MVDNCDKQEFINNIIKSLLLDFDEKEFSKEVYGLLLKDTRDCKLYKYRSFNKFSILNLKRGTLHCSAPCSLNDMFDCKIGLNIKSFINMLSETCDFNNVFQKFIKIYNNDITLKDCNNEEQLIFSRWLNNDNICSFMDKFREHNFCEKELESYFHNKYADVFYDFISVFFEANKMTEYLPLIKEFLVGTYKSVPFDNLTQFLDGNNIFKIMAHNLGIETDADDISLAKEIFQTILPNHSKHVIAMDKSFSEVIHKIGALIDTNCRIGSLCTDYKNNLMWSYYADSHRGFCIEYDFKSNYEMLEKTMLLPVIYLKERPVFPLELVLDSNGNTIHVKNEISCFILFSLLVKDEAWKHENEWRIIHSAKTKCSDVKMPPISCVYIGTNCSERDKKKIIRFAKRKKIKVKQMIMDRGDFELHAESINV